MFAVNSRGKSTVHSGSAEHSVAPATAYDVWIQDEPVADEGRGKSAGVGHSEFLP